MNEEQKIDAPQYFIWLGLLLAGVFLFLFRNTHDSPWFDEVFSRILIKHDFGQIWNLTAGDVHPPLYYFLLKLYGLVFGNSIFALRAFSAIGALALAALGGGPIRRIFGTKAGLLFTFLVVFNPMVIGLAQELRMYSWAAFFLTGSGLYAYWLTKSHQTSDWIRFGLYSVAAAYTHYYALIAVCFINLIVFLRLLFKAKSFMTKYLLTAGLMVTAYVPWLVSVIPLVLKKNFHLDASFETISGNGWLPKLTGGQVVNILVSPFDNIFRAPKEMNLNFSSLAIPAFLLVGLLIGWALRTAFRRQDPGRAMLTLGVETYLLTFLAGVAISLAFRPAFIERYMFPLLGFLFIPVAYILARTRNRVIVGVILAWMILVAIPPVYNIYRERFNGPTVETVEYIQAHLKSDDVFIHTDEHSLCLFLDAFPRHRHLLYTGSKIIQFYSHLEAFAPPAVISDKLAAFEPYLRGHDTWHVNRIDSPGLLLQEAWLADGVFINPVNKRTFIIDSGWCNFLVYKATTGNLSLADRLQ